MTLLFQIGTMLPNITQNMENMGLFLYLFPFLLALAIFYGVLHWTMYDAQKPKLPKSAITLISIILAFFVMLYTSWNTMIVTFFASLSGAGLIVATGILFVAILLGLVGFDIKGLTDENTAGKKGRWVFIIGVLFIGILIFFGAGGGAFGLIPNWSSNGEFLTVLFVIGIIGLAIWWLGNDDNGKAAAKSS
jgi:hypothetical protein